jgi:uncharacterized membrane-anchored protein YitT (DUF2179 family)
MLLTSRLPPLTARTSRGLLILMNRWLRELLNALLISFGVLSAGMGLKGFLLSSHFIDGGVTGVSMLLAKTTSLPLSIWLPLVNIPFIALAYRSLGLAFAVRSTLAIAGLSLALFAIPYPDVTQDLLLTAVFGGFFIGAGIGLAIRGGAVLDGTEIAALIISKRSHLVKVGDVILASNIILFLVAMAVLGIDSALYSILTYLTAARTLNFVIYGLEEFTAVTIVSSESVTIQKQITESLGRGMTVLRGYGGKSGEDQEIIYCVVTRLEVGRVKEITLTADRQAFITIHSLADTFGGTVKRAHHI